MVSLGRVPISDAVVLHDLQTRAFAALLKRYQDFDTNPGAESVERVMAKLQQPNSDFYFVRVDATNVGGVRVVRLEAERRCRIAPIFVLPEHQGRGIAQAVFRLLEQQYAPPSGWILDTILEEAGNCHLYEKLGFIRTGTVEELRPGMHLVCYEKPTPKEPVPMDHSLPTLDYQFSAPLESNSTYNIFVTVPRSKEVLGTGKAVKVGGTIDGHPFEATLMPSGDGLHWLPLRIAIRKAIGKDAAGLVVAVHLTKRTS